MKILGLVLIAPFLSIILLALLTMDMSDKSRKTISNQSLAVLWVLIMLANIGLGLLFLP